MKSKSGFTLIELMVVVIVISIIASIVVLTYDSQMKAARDQSAESSLITLSAGLDSYYNKNGAYPLACPPHLSICKASSYAERGATAPPIISTSTTPQQLHDIIPEVSKDFAHPRLSTNTPINQSTYVSAGVLHTLNMDSYFVFAPDSYAFAPPTNGLVNARLYFSESDGSTLECRFSTRDYRYMDFANKGRRPYPYVLGYYSEVDQAWQFYKSDHKPEQNLLEWNTYNNPGCEAEDIGALKS